MTICGKTRKSTDFIRAKDCPIGLGRCRQCEYMMTVKKEVSEVAKYKKLKK